MLIASLVLHQVKEVGAVTQKEINFECRTLAYISLVLTILGLAMVAVLHYRKSKFCKGHAFSNAVKIMVFISDVQNYIPIKLSKTACSINLFKIAGMLKAKNIKLNKNYLWDMLEIDWKDITVTFNENKINLSRLVTVKLKDEVKVKTFDEETTYTFPSNAEARNYMVYFSCRQARDCINNATN